MEVLLAQLNAAPGRWILVVKEPICPSRYVQFFCHEHGSLISEVTSNYYLDTYDEARRSWTEVQNNNLFALGCEPREPPGRPNWVDI